MESLKFKVNGIFVEKYTGVRYVGGNCNFDEIPEEMEKYHIFCEAEDDKKYVVSLETTHGICGSGWAPASYGHMWVEETEQFGPLSHKPNGELEFALDFVLDEGEKMFYPEAENSVFEVSETGGDEYYPEGYACINWDKFIPLS